MSRCGRRRYPRGPAPPVKAGMKILPEEEENGCDRATLKFVG